MKNLFLLKLFLEKDTEAWGLVLILKGANIGTKNINYNCYFINNK